MKRLGAVALVATGVLALLLGMLFLLGAGGQVHRYAIGAVALALGGICAGLGIRLFRSADADAPDRLLADILELARRRNGEISEAEVIAGLKSRARLAPAVLERVVAAGLCRKNDRNGSTFFVFSDLQPRLFVRRCAYCGAEVSIATAGEKCPRCGGALRTQVETRSLSGGEYRMDDES